MTQEGFERKLIAVLSADVVGYSRHMEEENMTTVRNDVFFGTVRGRHFADGKSHASQSELPGFLSELIIRTTSLFMEKDHSVIISIMNKRSFHIHNLLPFKHAHRMIRPYH